MAGSFFNKYKDHLLLAAVLLFGAWLLRDYFVPRIQLAIGMIVAPFVFKVKEKGVFSQRYAFVALCCLALYFAVHINVLLFFAVGCLLFYIVESRWGKIGLLPFLFLICISPALHYAVNVFTFSIRLKLSELAATLLNFGGVEVINKGSYFVRPDGFSFNVDTACIGLNMFNTGLYLVVLMLAFTGQRYKKNLGVGGLLFVFTLAVLLLLLTNLMRIVTLVLFNSMPGTLSHDLIGLASLIVYLLLPMYLIIRLLIKYRGREDTEPMAAAPLPFLKSSGIALVLVVLTVFSYNHVSAANKLGVVDEKLVQLQLPGFTKRMDEYGVAEYRRDSVLIYIKPPSKAYESDHPPAMCWMGSGFTLEEISRQQVNGCTILTAILKKDKTVQYTAWWYDNGSHKTVEQWEWRLSKDEPYRTVNITATSKEELEQLCSEFLKKKLF